MATMEQLTDEKDLMPLRSTTLNIEGMKQQQNVRSLAIQRLQRQARFIREVGAPSRVQISGVAHVIDRKKEQDEYELKKNLWMQRSML